MTSVTTIANITSLTVRKETILPDHVVTLAPCLISISNEQRDSRDHFCGVYRLSFFDGYTCTELKEDDFSITFSYVEHSYVQSYQIPHVNDKLIKLPIMSLSYFFAHLDREEVIPCFTYSPQKLSFRYYVYLMSILKKEEQIDLVNAPKWFVEDYHYYREKGVHKYEYRYFDTSNRDYYSEKKWDINISLRDVPVPFVKTEVAPLLGGGGDEVPYEEFPLRTFRHIDVLELTKGADGFFLTVNLTHVHRDIQYANGAGSNDVRVRETLVTFQPRMDDSFLYVVTTKPLVDILTLKGSIYKSGNCSIVPSVPLQSGEYAYLTVHCRHPMSVKIQRMIGVYDVLPSIPPISITSIPSPMTLPDIAQSHNISLNKARTALYHSPEIGKMSVVSADKFFNLANVSSTNWKGALLEFVQKKKLVIPSFSSAQSGTAHAPTWTCQIKVNGLFVSCLGVFNTKKEAEFSASYAALTFLQSLYLADKRNDFIVSATDFIQAYSSNACVLVTERGIQCTLDGVLLEFYASGMIVRDGHPVTLNALLTGR